MRETRDRRERRSATGGIGVDFAWDGLLDLQDVIRGADQKASIVLTLAAAVTGLGLNALFDERGRLGDPSAFAEVLAALGLVALAAAILSALLVIFPRLGRRRSRPRSNDLLYFGALRRRTSEDVARQLAALDEQAAIRQLADHLVVLGTIAWRKHELLQAAVAAFTVGAALLVVALLAG